MNRYKLPLSISFLILLLSLSACQKNKWKTPTEVTFSIGITEKQGGPGTLVFDEGYLTISRFWIEGTREQAQDIFFERNFEDGLEISFWGGVPVPSLKFDIPQGTYSSLRIGFETYEGENRNSLFVSGIYEYNNPNKDSIPTSFEVNSKDYFEMPVRSSTGANEIVLQAEHPTSPEIILDPKHWFKNISSSAMDNANPSTVNNEEKIIINKDENSDIYDMVIGRVGGAATTTIP